MSSAVTPLVIIEGYVEAIGGNSVHGWINTNCQNAEIRIMLGNVLVGSGVAHKKRNDLAKIKEFAKGFSIECDRKIGPGDLIEGNLIVILHTPEHSEMLHVWPPLIEAGRLSRIDITLLKKAWNSVPSYVKTELLESFSSKLQGRGYGRLSFDGTAQAGRNGYLFLAGGTNHLTKLYSNEISVDIKRWLDCFLQRKNLLTQCNARYVQLIIPEKSSVLHEYTPYHATPGSAPYANLVEQSLRSGVPLCDVLPELLLAKDVHSIYPLGDTHFTTDGAEVVVHSLLRYFGECASHYHPTAVKQLRTGDLSGRFLSDGDIQELETRYESISFNEKLSSPRLDFFSDPKSGHQGIQRVWKNESAIIDKTVICFGNSFFERGGSSAGLSWWFARLFKEFHFIWTPNLDIEYVERVKPNIVICQTIERFLTQTPSS